MLVSCSTDDATTSTETLSPIAPKVDHSQHYPPGTSFALRFVATATAEERDIIPVPGSGTDKALCFDGDLLDLETGRLIGTATDCLADISGDDVVGMALVGTTIFNLPGGSFTSRGNTTVQPILTDPTGTPITHVTGAIPHAGQNSIIDGTGKFEDASGSVRLSGAVNLSNLGAGEITFDCVFIINLD
jgi:hypothetical protein